MSSHVKCNKNHIHRTYISSGNVVRCACFWRTIFSIYIEIYGESLTPLPDIALLSIL